MRNESRAGIAPPFHALPMPACRYVEQNGASAMLATKRLAGVTRVTPEVNLMEHVTQVQNRNISDPTKVTYVLQK